MAFKIKLNSSTTLPFVAESFGRTGASARIVRVITPLCPKWTDTLSYLDAVWNSNFGLNQQRTPTFVWFMRETRVARMWSAGEIGRFSSLPQVRFMASDFTETNSLWNHPTVKPTETISLKYFPDICHCIEHRQSPLGVPESNICRLHIQHTMHSIPRSFPSTSNCTIFEKQTKETSIETRRIPDERIPNFKPPS